MNTRQHIHTDTERMKRVYRIGSKATESTILFAVCCLVRSSTFFFWCGIFFYDSLWQSIKSLIKQKGFKSKKNGNIYYSLVLLWLYRQFYGNIRNIYGIRNRAISLAKIYIFLESLNVYPLFFSSFLLFPFFVPFPFLFFCRLLTVSFSFPYPSFSSSQTLNSLLSLCRIYFLLLLLMLSLFKLNENIFRWVMFFCVL